MNIGTLTSRSIFKGINKKGFNKKELFLLIALKKV